MARRFRMYRQDGSAYGIMYCVDRKQRVNAVLERTIGYQFSRPLADRAWRVPPPKLLNSVLVRVTGYQLSRPLAGRALEAACGRRREAADRAGVRLFRAPGRLDAAPGHPGQPLAAVRPAGAAAQAPRRPRGDEVDPGLARRARADRRRRGAHALGPGARRGTAAQRQAPPRGQDAGQRAGPGSASRPPGRTPSSSSCCVTRPRRWPRCNPRSTRRGNPPRKPGAWRSPWPRGCGI